MSDLGFVPILGGSGACCNLYIATQTGVTEMQNEALEKMQAKVIALLIKRGHNPECATQWVRDHLQVAMQAYPNSRPHFYADVCMCL